MQHLSSPDSEGPSEEDPQPPEPSPLHRYIQTLSLDHHGSCELPHVVRLERVVRLRPDDFLNTLQDTYEVSLLVSLMNFQRPRQIDDYDTYTHISMEVSLRSWRFKIENISGTARSVMYDLDRPGHVEIYDGMTDEDSGVYTATHRTALDLSPEDTGLLQSESFRVSLWFDEGSNLGRSAEHSAGRSEVVRPPEQITPPRMSLLQRLGGLSLLRLR